MLYDPPLAMGIYVIVFLGDVVDVCKGCDVELECPFQDIDSIKWFYEDGSPLPVIKTKKYVFNNT